MSPTVSQSTKHTSVHDQRSRSSLWARAGDLNDIDVVEGQLSDLVQVFQRFEKDFPSAERMERTHLKLLLSKARHHLLLARHRVFDDLIGYAFVYEPETPAMIWLDYMAIDERF